VTDHAIVKPWDVKALEARDHTKKELSLRTYHRLRRTPGINIRYS
jgi:hypothetical protein